MIATTIEQSQHLLELGLDPSTADMFWKYSASLGNTDINGRIAVSYHDNLFVGKYDGAIPAWSLSALLRVLPLGTELYKMCNDAHEIYYEIDCAGATGWVGYEDSDPITAAYEMICWLLEQGLIKKGDNDE